MPIVSSDIETRLSGGASNADPNLSLGGIMSSNVWNGGSLHDLFDVITGDENAASTVDYRCIYVRNKHASLTWIGVKVWISAQQAGGADCTIGLDPAGSGDGNTTGKAVTIANETTAPAGVMFTNPVNKAGGLTIGDLAPGKGAAIWIKRAATNSPAINNDSCTITLEGDTAA